MSDDRIAPIQSKPSPPPPPKTFNEVSLEALEFTVERIAAIDAQLRRVTVDAERIKKDLEDLNDKYNALEVKVDDWIDQTRPLPPAA